MVVVELQALFPRTMQLFYSSVSISNVGACLVSLMTSVDVFNVTV